MSKEIISTKNAPNAVGPYSQAVVTGNMVFTAGQIALDPATGKLLADDITIQTEKPDGGDCPVNGRSHGRRFKFRKRRQMYRLLERYERICRHECRVRTILQRKSTCPFSRTSRCPAPRRSRRNRSYCLHQKLRSRICKNSS